MRFGGVCLKEGDLWHSGAQGSIGIAKAYPRVHMSHRLNSLKRESYRGLSTGLLSGLLRVILVQMFKSLERQPAQVILGVQTMADRMLWDRTLTPEP